MPMTELKVHRPGLTPPIFYEGLLRLCGVHQHHQVPKPHEASAFHLTSDGAKFRLVIDTEDGRQVVIENDLNRMIRGLL